jgi:hypothetical protein
MGVPALGYVERTDDSAPVDSTYNSIDVQFLYYHIVGGLLLDGLSGLQVGFLQARILRVDHTLHFCEFLCLLLFTHQLRFYYNIIIHRVCFLNILCSRSFFALGRSIGFLFKQIVMKSFTS